MTAITYTGATPTVGADEDTWGTEINTSLGQIAADLAMLNASPTARILGRNDGGTGEVERLTGAEVVAMLDAVAGATQTVVGTQGVVPTPPIASQHMVLTGAGTFQSGYGRAFGCVITTTSVNGSTPTIAGAKNIASISNITEAAGVASAILTFTNPMVSSAYCVNVSRQNSSNYVSYDSKSTTTVVIQWATANPAEISVSGFA